MLRALDRAAEDVPALLEDLLNVQRKTGRALSNQDLLVALRAVGHDADGATKLSQMLLDQIPLPGTRWMK